MQYFADIGEDGNILGFYSDEDHAGKIPATAVRITEEQWQTYSADGNRYKHDGEIIREKTQMEIDEGIAVIPPVQKSPTEQRLEDIELALADLFTGGEA